MPSPELDQLLDGLVETADCISCGLCCTFHDEDKVDAPLFTDAQRVQVENAPYGDGVTFSERGGMWQVDLAPQGNGSYVCPILDPDTRMCRAREVDNFHCRTWPVQVVRRDGDTVVTLSPDCPAAMARRNNPAVQARLASTVVPFMLTQAEENPGLVEDYRDGLIVIASGRIPLRSGLGNEGG